MFLPLCTSHINNQTIARPPMPTSAAQPGPGSNGNAAGANAKRPSKIRRAASRFRKLFRRNRKGQQTHPAQGTSQKQWTTQASTNGAVANKEVARDRTSTADEATHSFGDSKPPRPTKTLISQTKAKAMSSSLSVALTEGLIELNVRMEAKQKRKRYYVDAAGCPISVIKAMFANEYGLAGGSQALILRFDGHRLRDDSTPAQYDMESGDLIDAFLSDE